MVAVIFSGVHIDQIVVVSIGIIQASIAPAVPLSKLVDVIQISDDMELIAAFAQTLKINF